MTVLTQLRVDADLLDAYGDDLATKFAPHSVASRIRAAVDALALAVCSECRTRGGIETGTLRDDGPECPDCDEHGRGIKSHYWPCTRCTGTGHLHADCGSPFHAVVVRATTG